MPPTMRQVFAAVLMQLAALCCDKVGDALTAPADVTVVVPGVTALMVSRPAPVLMMVTAVPMPKSVVASVGMLTVLVEAFEVRMRTWYWSEAASV